MIADQANKYQTLHKDDLGHFGYAVKTIMHESAWFSTKLKLY